MVRIVRPISREYPKCRDGIAATTVSLSAGDGIEELAILIAESVLSPDTACTLLTVDSIDEAVALS